MALPTDPLSAFLFSRRRLLATTGLGMAAATVGVGLPRSGAYADTPKKGGTLTMARTADVVSFEPVVPTDNMSIWRSC
jgi:hypothetical protein